MTASPGELLRLDVHGARMARSAGTASRTVAEDLGFTSNDADRASDLVTELCQVVCHTDFDDPDEARFELAVAEAPAALTFTITDRGLPFSLAGEQAGTVAAHILKTSTADHLEVSSDGDANTITAQIRRDPSTEQHLVDDDTPTDEIADPAPPRVERLRHEHLESLARCTWRVYGHTYVASFLYHPDDTWKMVESGRLHSVVALDADDEVIGHVGIELERAGDSVGDATLALTDPRYRATTCSARWSPTSPRSSTRSASSARWPRPSHLTPSPNGPRSKTAGSRPASCWGSSPPR